jgi:hypothetical protein
MTKSSMVLAVSLALWGSSLVHVDAQQKGPTVSPLTDQDRAQMQKLVDDYARALGTCAAEDYAALFAAPDGYFASGPRGKVVGRQKLIELVKSERHCNDNSARAPRNAPTVVTVEPSPDGATGRAAVGTAGYYDDVYVKTAQGWRFKGRNFISAQEEAAKLTARDFIELRRLAGNDTGQFDDVYTNTPAGRQFRSSGVVIAPSPEGATGKALLKQDGGYYDDSYVRSPRGWRFKSRLYVAAATESAKGAPGPESTRSNPKP